MKINRILILFCCMLYNTSPVLLMNCESAVDICEKQLGALQNPHTFVCDASDRGSNFIEWWQDDTMLPLDDTDKYTTAINTLTVNNIVNTDEGNYSCKYQNTMGDIVQLHAECLLVYGTGFFRDSNEDIRISYLGTVTFDMTLSFSLPGPCGYMEEVDDYILKNNYDMELVHCEANTNCEISPTSSDQWWTIAWDSNNNIMYILHQAQSSDRGTYTAQVEGTDPSGSGKREISRTVDVEAQDCGVDYPILEGGLVISLEPVDQDIVGAQANYSCNDSCLIFGSNSLRCKVTLGESEWVNEMGVVDTPSCSCQDSLFITTQNLISTSFIEPSATTDINTSSVISLPNEQSQNRGLLIGISVGLSVFVLLIVIAAIVLNFIIWKFNIWNGICWNGIFEHQKKKEFLSHTDKYQPQTVREDPARFSTVINEDGNLDDDIDFDNDNTKNSHVTNI